MVHTVKSKRVADCVYFAVKRVTINLTAVSLKALDTFCSCHIQVFYLGVYMHKMTNLCKCWHIWSSKLQESKEGNINLVVQIRVISDAEKGFRRADMKYMKKTTNSSARYQVSFIANNYYE